WVDERIAADLFISANRPVTSGGQILPMNEQLGREIADDTDLRGRVERVLPVRFQQLGFRNRIVFAVAIDAVQTCEILRERAPVSGVELYPRLRNEPGAVIVSDNFAALNGMKPGDHFTVRGRHGPVELHVIGSVPDYTWNRGTILMDRTWFLEQFGDSLA